MSDSQIFVKSDLHDRQFSSCHSDHWALED